MSVKWNLNDIMTPKKLPVSTAVLLKRVRNLVIQLSTYCFLHFLQVIKNVTFSELQSRWRPSLILYVSLASLLVKVFFSSKKVQTSQRFPCQLQDFPSVSFSTRTFAQTNKSLRLFPLWKPIIGTSGKTSRCCTLVLTKSWYLIKYV